MNVLIVEDETTAYENMVALLKHIDASIEIVGNTESIRQTIKWLQEHEAPDLIFMDIHLSDGSAFFIFDAVQVETPIIFTTAYDQYAIDAFKVNSIDYLLKPVKEDELKRALQKYRKWNRQDVGRYLSQLMEWVAKPNYPEKLLISHRDELLPVRVADVACFYTTDKMTSVYLKSGRMYAYNRTLEQILSMLDPHSFYRANKQFIIAKDSVQHIKTRFDNRLLIALSIETPEPIYVSKNKASEFKNWILS